MSKNLDLVISISADVKKLESGIATAKKGITSLNSKVSQASKENGKLSASNTKVTKSFAASKKEITRLNSKISAQNVKLAVLAKRLDSTTKKTKKQKKNNEGLAASFSAVKAGIVAVAIAIVIRYVAATSLAGLANDRLRISMKAVVGDSALVGEELGFVKKEADRLGLSYLALGRGYVSLSAAAKDTALEGKGIRDIFSAVSESASVLQLSTADTSGVMRALEQMMSKGVVTSEEFKLQFAERIPGAMKLGADAIGVGREEFVKMLTTGKLITEDFLPKLAAQMKKNMADGVEEASNSAAASFNRFSTSFNQMQDGIADSGLNVVLASFADLGTKMFRSVSTGAGEATKETDSLAAAYKILNSVQKEANDRGEERSASAIATARKRLNLGKLQIDQAIEFARVVDSEFKKSDAALKKRAKAEKDFAKSRIKFSTDVIKSLKTEIAASVKEVEKFTTKINSLLLGRASEVERTEDELREIRRGSLTEQEQQADIVNQVSDTQLEAQRALINGSEEEAQRLADKARTLASQLNDEQKLVEFIKISSRITIEAKDSEIAKVEEQRAEESARQQAMQNDLKATQKEVDLLSAALKKSKTEAESLHNVINLLSDPININIKSNLKTSLSQAQELQDKLKELFGSSATVSSSLSDVGGSIAGGLPKFAHGGSILVPGNGGVDTQTVMAKVSPGEQLTVETPAQQQQRSGGGGITIDRVIVNGVTNAREFIDQLVDISRTEPLEINIASAGVIDG